MCFACTEAPTNSLPPPQVVNQRDASNVDTDAGLLVDAGRRRTDGGAFSDAGTHLFPALGINAFAPELGDAGSVDESRLALLDLELLALRVGATEVSMGWDSLDVTALVERIDRLSEAGVAVALEIELVSGVRSLTPGRTPTASDVSPAIEALFEQNLSARYLIVGSLIDVRLAKLSPERRNQFVDFIEQWMRDTIAHPKRPETLRVGFNVSVAGALNASPELKRLTESAQVIGLDWLALDAQHQPLDAAAATSTLQELLSSPLAARPLIIQQLAYPSSVNASSSLAGQAVFFDLFLDALASHGARVPFVAVSSLDDPPRASCEQRAANAAEGNVAVTEAWCSIGLRRRDSTPKLAFTSMIEGLARFSSR
jgi:hypothetical protein